MFPSEKMPFQQIYATLDSVASTHVRKVILDLNLDKVADLDMDTFVVGMRGLDERLHHVAELSAANIGSNAFTVMFSALRPFLSMESLVHVGRMGPLVLGTRYHGSDVCGELSWLGEFRGAKVV